MKDITEFHIIGRIGRIDADKKVTHISVAANYNRFDGHSWKSDARWNRLTLFGELRDKLAKADIGDLVRVTGVRRQNIWPRLRLRLAERWLRLGFDIRRRVCGVASADVRWSVV